MSVMSELVSRIRLPRQKRSQIWMDVLCMLAIGIGLSATAFLISHIGKGNRLAGFGIGYDTCDVLRPPDKGYQSPYKEQ